MAGKSFDTFAPLGPYIATFDDALVSKLSNLHIGLKLNGSFPVIRLYSQNRISLEVFSIHLQRTSRAKEQHEADDI
jgi:2-keto-4-pentenoate hydratase/2-oxohepta-3-ene-1,7-dioic acid hydratase in catechol pathway